MFINWFKKYICLYVYTYNIFLWKTTICSKTKDISEKSVTGFALHVSLVCDLTEDHQILICFYM